MGEESAAKVSQNPQLTDYITKCIKSFAEIPNGSYLRTFLNERCNAELSLPEAEKCPKCYQFYSPSNTSYQIKSLLKNTRFLRRQLKRQKEIGPRTVYQQQSIERLKRVNANMRFKRLIIICRFCKFQRSQVLKMNKKSESLTNKTEVIKLLKDVLTPSEIQAVFEKRPTQQVAKVIKNPVDKFKQSLSMKKTPPKSNDTNSTQAKRNKKKKKKSGQFAGLNAEAVLSVASSQAVNLKKLPKKKNSN